jgi:hypothetical protein
VCVAGRLSHSHSLLRFVGARPQPAEVVLEELANLEAAALLEEEERDEAAAQTKVRLALPSPHIERHSGGERT